jgi:hypothetical protein
MRKTKKFKFQIEKEGFTKEEISEILKLEGWRVKNISVVGEFLSANNPSITKRIMTLEIELVEARAHVSGTSLF